MVINRFDIDTTTMPSTATTRSFIVSGQKGAQFKIFALQAGTLKYYDFTNNAFELGHNNSDNNLDVTLSSNIYKGKIFFPSGGGDYIVKLLLVNGTTFSSSPVNIMSRTIPKESSVIVVTVKPGSIANLSTYATLPETESAGGGVTSTATVNFDWDVTNASTDANGYGLRLAQSTIEHIALDRYWYFTTTENVADNPAGDGEDSNTITVADLTDLGVGSELVYHKGTTVPTNKAGSAVGTTTITAINTTTKVVTFSQEVAFEDGETMTFKAQGATAIYNAIGLVFESTIYPVVTTTTLTQTVRADSDGDFTPSTTITLNDTHGISGGNVVKYKGFGVNNSSSNLVSTVTADVGGGDSNGAVVVQLAQTLKAGTKLTFDGSYKTINITGSIFVSSYPTASKTIYFDLDLLITPGVSGS